METNHSLWRDQQESSPLPGSVEDEFDLVTRDMEKGLIDATTAYERALSIFNEITDYGDVDAPLDTRVYAAIQINKFEKAAQIFDKISQQTTPTADDAFALSRELNRLSGQKIGENIERFDGSTPQTSFDEGADVRDYRNTLAFSAALFEEQWHAESGVTNGQIASNEHVRVPNGNVIKTLCEHRLMYAKTDREEVSLQEKERVFKILLNELLPQTEMYLSQHKNFHVSRAANHLLTAKSLHDLALLGEFSSKEQRNEAIEIALTELWVARDEISQRAHDNDTTEGVAYDIDIFIKKYSYELGVDHTIDPRAIEDSTADFDKDFRKLVEGLGVAATEKVLAPVRRTS